MRIKTENVKESLEPVDVDKAGSEASEEGTHGLSKMVALLGYCTEFLNPGTTRICQCTIQVYTVFRSSDHGDLSRKKSF